MRINYQIRSVVFLVILLTIVGGRSSETAAQQQNKWYPQARVPYYDDLILRSSHLIADRNRTVHAFDAQVLNDEDEAAAAIVAIVYRQWTPSGGWTTPLDVILPPRNQLPAWEVTRGMGVFLDQSDTVHMAIVSGDDTHPYLYYTRAPLLYAGQAPAWSRPAMIDDQAKLRPAFSTITGDSSGKLHIVYSGGREGNGVYATYSADGGDSWSEPIPVFRTYSDEVVPAHLKLYADKQDRLHALWSLVDVSGLSDAIYYARLDPGQDRWTDPFVLAEEFGGFTADFPNIVEYENELFVNYHNDSPTTIWIRRSNDGGRTWTTPVKFAPGFVGSNGAISYVIDSNNTLHAFFGNRVEDQTYGQIHGMWHRVWLGDQWSGIEAVVSGPQVRDGLGGKGFDPNGATAIASQGNVLLVTWVTDGAAGENGAWYSYLVLDAPELPVKPLQTPPATPTPAAKLTPTAIPASPTPTRNPAFAQGDSLPTGSRPTNPAAPVAFGIIPALLLIVLIVFVRRIYFYR